jgi:hypothetical protein
MGADGSNTTAEGDPRAALAFGRLACENASSTLAEAPDSATMPSPFPEEFRP